MSGLAQSAAAGRAWDEGHAAVALGRVVEGDLATRMASLVDCMGVV